MTPASCLKNTLYQEFFSGKGSLEIECLDEKKPTGESFEFYEKKGKLYLKADNESTLSLALSFLGRLPPEEALGYLGKWTPKFPLRALNIKEETVCSDRNVLRYGFNTCDLVIDFSQAAHTTDRDKTLLDLSLEELKASSADVFFCDEAKVFLELDFVPGKRKLSFQSESIWDLLLHSPPIGTPLLPTIKLEDIQEKLPGYLNQMVRHPFQGIIVEVNTLPSPGSTEEKALLAAGFGCYLGTPHNLWF